MSGGPQQDEGSSGPMVDTEQRQRAPWLVASVAGVLIALGTYLALAPPSPPPPVSSPGVSLPTEAAPAPAPKTAAPVSEVATKVLATEVLTKSLTRQLRRIASHYEVGSSGQGASPVFASGATANALVRPAALDGALTPGEIRVLDWEVSEKVSTPDVLLRSVFEGLASLEQVHFEIEYGRYPTRAVDRAESLFHVEIVGRSPSGHLVAVTGQVNAAWRQSGTTTEQHWLLTNWQVTELRTVEVEGPLFTDVLGAVVDDATRKALEHSEHADKLLALLEHGPSHRPRHPFDHDSLDRHPGLAVVDINGDGWDDVYVMPRWGTNQLLVNQRGERFVESAAAWGLDLKHNASSAIFADMDNDGDPDALIGRTLQDSVFLLNDGGRFQPVGEAATGGPLPRLVSSVSVVDYDGDGLLDVLFSTYASSMVLKAREWVTDEGKLGQPVLEGFVSDADAARLGTLLAEASYQAHLSRPGPPNRLYRNVGGGRLEPVDSSLGVFRSTFQASWSDYDGDGDPDVYLANDHAANHLFRNDAGTFIDVTAETGTADLGFGMGATWGDYDDDGRFDLYVSNMYSRAGRRITGALTEIDPRMRRAAGGNTLFHNEGERFVQTSSLGPEGLQVERAGWAWGAQFGDLNNDGFEDLYVLNGHYSAPKKVAIDHDS